MLVIIPPVNSFGTNLEHVTMNKYGASLFNMRKNDKTVKNFKKALHLI